MSQTIYDRLRPAMAFVNNTHGFEKEAKIIRETHYAMRQWWEPYPPKNNTVTFDRRYVKLGQNFFQVKDTLQQAATLVHEAVHCMQIERLGLNRLTWIGYYIFHQKALEDEAYDRKDDFLDAH